MKHVFTVLRQETVIVRSDAPTTRDEKFKALKRMDRDAEIAYDPSSAPENQPKNTEDKFHLATLKSVIPVEDDH